MRVNQIQSFFEFGYGRIYPIGVNSITTVTTKWRFANSAAAFYSLDFTYEAPVPEPATAPLFFVGAAVLLLLRRGRRTRQP